MTGTTTASAEKANRRWLSTQKMMRYINRTHNLTYGVSSLLAGGYQSGAYLLVCSQSQEKAVLKWDRRTSWADRVMKAAPVVAAAREAGWPTPEWLAHGVSPSGYPYVIQTFVPAAPVTKQRVTLELVNAAIDFVDKYHVGNDLNIENDWSSWDRHIVFDESADTSLAEQIRSHSAAGAMFVERLKMWVQPFHNVELRSCDLVHGDFQPGNILMDPDAPGHIVSVIDVEGLGRGSRLHDIANLIPHCLLWFGDPEALPALDRYARSIASPGEWEICVAARLYEMLYFDIYQLKDVRADQILDAARLFVESISQPTEDPLRIPKPK